MSSTQVRKAVIPAAGLGTRFLPATKSQPKEMLPLVDKPAIQYVVEEAVRSGIRDILVITSRGKSTIEDHFDRSVDLERRLEFAGKLEELATVRSIAELADVHFVRQPEPRGLGHAVATARTHVGNEPFAVLLPDDVIHEAFRVLGQMVDIYRRFGASVLALKEVADDEISSYGCARVAEVEEGIVRVLGLIEKPASEDAPSRLAVMGRYVLTPSIFSAMERVKPGAGGELQLTDGIVEVIQGEPVYGYVMSEGRYDIGNKLDYLRATIELALSHPELGEPFERMLKQLAQERGW